MKMLIKFNYTWGRSYISARGEERVTLLVEWYAGRLNSSRARPAKLITKDVQLFIWPEPGTTILTVHGARPRKDKSQAVMIPLGRLYEGEKHCLAIEISLSPQATGIHQTMAVQWRYKDLVKERFKHQPMEPINLHFTHHLGLLKKEANFHVEKHSQLLQSPLKLRDAMILCEQGHNEQGEWMLRRQADELLLLAIRKQDNRLMQEAELFYRLSEHCVGMNRSDFFLKNIRPEPASAHAIT